MRPQTGLGASNLALISLYFAPVWSREALAALRSPYSGFDDRAQAGAAAFFRQIFDFGLDGLMQTSTYLAGAKLVMAVAFLAYLIEFMRAVAVGREPDRATLNLALGLALAGTLIWALPAMALNDGAVIRKCATQFLLVAGALIVILVERHSLDLQATRKSTVPPEAPAQGLGSAPAGGQTWLPLPVPQTASRTTS
jgi:hypothetical protein